MADKADGLRHLALPQAVSQADGQSETEPRHVSVARLEDVETVHALTIHKSQGSEYGHAIVALPDAPAGS